MINALQLLWIVQIAASAGAMMVLMIMAGRE